MNRILQNLFTDRWELPDPRPSGYRLTLFVILVIEFWRDFLGRPATSTCVKTRPKTPFSQVFLL